MYRWFYAGIRLFREGRDFYVPNIVLSAVKGNLGVQSVEAPFEKPFEMADYVFCQHSKNNIGSFSNQRYIGVFFVYLCNHMPKTLLFYIFQWFFDVLKMFGKAEGMKTGSFF